MASEIRFQVDARSLRSFKRNVSIAGRGVANSTKDGLIEFCEEVLLDSVQLVPIDTGTLAQSNDYKITGNAKKGYEAKLGYAIGKRNPINRRTGQRASAYAGKVHEQIIQHENGQAKFFEQALYNHENELETYTGASIKKYLSAAVVGEFDSEHEENEGESKRQAIIAGRSQQGFTEQVDGKLLPFPVPEGLVYRKGGRWWLNRKYNKRQSSKYGKTSSATEHGVRSKEIQRYTAEKAPPKKRTKRSSKKTTTPKKTASKVSKKQSKTSKSIKGSRTPANRKTVKRTKFISELAHETALDEYIQYMIDEAAAKRKKKKEEKEEKRRWS